VLEIATCVWAKQRGEAELKYHDKPRMEHRNVYGTMVVKMSMCREEMADGTKSLLGIRYAFDIWSEQDEERRVSVRCGPFAVFYMISAYQASNMACTISPVQFLMSTR
jgi:hypothetical protein